MDASLKHHPSLAELHAHLSPSVSPAVYWHIAHSEGYKLPKRDYHEFVDYIVLSNDRKSTLREYLDTIYHPILNRLSSGTPNVEKAVYESFSGAYRSSNITLLELRCNPMRYNHDGEVDMDHVIMAMLRGMERALLEYPKLKGGLIFCLDRRFSYEKNKVIVEKAIKYHRRGIIGIDFATYNVEGFHFKDYQELIEKAKHHGLHFTAHSGETADDNDMWDCLKYGHPERIGHGIRAAYDKPLMKELSKRGITLEVCPLSNIMTQAVSGIDEMKFIIQTFWENEVKFCLNTDWPEMIKDGHITDQYELIRKHKILTEKQIDQVIKWGFEATFIPEMKNSNLYL